MFCSGETCLFTWQSKGQPSVTCQICKAGTFWLHRLECFWSCNSQPGQTDWGRQETHRHRRSQWLKEATLKSFQRPQLGRVRKSCTQVKVLLLYNNSNSSRSKSTHQNNYLSKSKNVSHKMSTQVVSNFIWCSISLSIMYYIQMCCDSQNVKILMHNIK